MKSCKIMLLLLSVILILVSLIDLKVGSYYISFSDLWDFLTKKSSDEVNLVLFDLRLPRILTAILSGAILSICGVVMQSIFNNDLVSPDLLGVSSGAACGASIGFLLGCSGVVVSLIAFGGGLIAVFITMLIAITICRDFQSSLLVMVLSGIVVSAFFSGIVSLICSFNPQSNQIMSILFFLFGSFAKVTMSDLYILIPLFLIVSISLWFLSYSLDLLSLGEVDARHQGVPTFIVRNIVIVLSTLTCAFLISKTGIIGWVGLVVPHIARFMVGTLHRILLPISALLGSIIMVIIDLISRSIFTYELPIGVITSIIGAPVFVFIMLRAVKLRENA